ncbi:hypothetical protein [Paraglaciecola sp. L1A13]|uniref:hypothetical protein n=1 Tax=Paraglaciecola sp. L1A13 TaxID=2686359 RepID=UPI00131E678E|nr:hypothetical protein [Paraglaciecola sp. L1A13]
MIQRILITYDFLSTSTQRGLINQANIFSIFVTLLKKLNLTVDSKINNFSREDFFSLNKIKLKNDLYQDICLADITTQGRNYLVDKVKQYDIIIGCELTSNTRDILSDIDVIYIDIWLSPIRFYKDVMFEFSSNNMVILEKLRSFKFDNRKLYKQVDSLRQHNQNFLTQFVAKPNSCLLVGQMLQDKSVLYNERFLNFIDYEKNIKKLSQDFERVYLLKHPYLNMQDFKPIQQQLEKIQNVVFLQNINTYQLLLQPEITCVAGISSSVISESEYFNKKSIFFHKPVIDPEYIRIFKDYCSTQFWASILNVGNNSNIVYFMEDNFFRLKYGMSYSYEVFMPNDLSIKTDVKEKYVSLINLYQFIQDLDRSQDYILYGLGSVGMLLFPHICDNLVAIVDKVKSEKISEYKNIPVIPITSIENFSDSKILISAFLYNNEILFDLQDFSNPIIIIDGL